MTSTRQVTQGDGQSTQQLHLARSAKRPRSGEGRALLNAGLNV